MHGFSVEEAAKRVEESVHLVASLRAQVKGAKATEGV